MLEREFKWNVHTHLTWMFCPESTSTVARMEKDCGNNWEGHLFWSCLMTNLTPAQCRQLYSLLPRGAWYTLLSSSTLLLLQSCCHYTNYSCFHKSKYSPYQTILSQSPPKSHFPWPLPPPWHGPPSLQHQCWVLKILWASSFFLVGLTFIVSNLFTVITVCHPFFSALGLREFFLGLAPLPPFFLLCLVEMVDFHGDLRWHPTNLSLLLPTSCPQCLLPLLCHLGILLTVSAFWISDLRWYTELISRYLDSSNCSMGDFGSNPLSLSWGAPLYFAQPPARFHQLHILLPCTAGWVCWLQLPRSPASSDARFISAPVPCPWLWELRQSFVPAWTLHKISYYTIPREGHLYWTYLQNRLDNLCWYMTTLLSISIWTWALPSNKVLWLRESTGNTALYFFVEFPILLCWC